MGFSLCPNMGYCTRLTLFNIDPLVQNIPRTFCMGATALANLVIPDNVVSIGDSAFMGCTSLSTLQIGSGVTNIGASTFNSTGLTAITVRATTPPTIGSNCFVGVSSSTPVTVPCLSIRTYQAATGWNCFSNISGGSACNATVRVLSNNNDYGSCSGGRVCTIGDTVQIAAIPAQGCNFVQWNDNNTDNPRDIIVTQDTTFTAYFEQQTGIESAENESVLVVSGNRTITAYNLSAGTFAIYDLGGRCLMRHTVASGATMRFDVPAAGLYVVRNNNSSIKIAVK